MKKFLLFAVVFAAQCLYAHTPPPDFKKYLNAFDYYDCDACGCSASGGGMGFSSMIDRNFVGLRYFYQSYSSRSGVFYNSPWVDENFNTLQLWARLPVTNRVQVSAQVPYHFHNRALATGQEEINGLGDVTVLGLYTAYQTKKDSAVFKHIVQLGGGIKAPTGSYNAENNGSVNPSFQLGTGSWDYILATEYTLRRNNTGFNAMVNYVSKTENKEEYQFGNQLNYMGTFFYEIEKPNYTIVPQAGIAGEVYAANRQYSEDLPNTKGDILFGKLGVEAGKDRFSVGINGMLPISQNLTGGRVKANYRWAVNLNYSL